MVWDISNPAACAATELGLSVEQIRRVFGDNWRIIFYNSPQKHILWVLGKAILMSTHNICFYGEITKIIPKLSQNPSSVPLGSEFCLKFHILCVRTAKAQWRMPRLAWAFTCPLCDKTPFQWAGSYCHATYIYIICLYCLNLLFEPEHDKTSKNYLPAQRRIRSASVSAKDPNLL